MDNYILDDLTRDQMLAGTEVIDGITVVHTGKYELVHQGYREKYYWEGEGNVDLGHEPEEIVEMYDSNGNKFCSNFDSIEEANKLIAKLAEEGITAIIGPKAPWRENGKIVPNRKENAVGVFLVAVPEKNDDFSSPKTR